MDIHTLFVGDKVSLSVPQITASHKFAMLLSCLNLQNAGSIYSLYNRTRQLFSFKIIYMGPGKLHSLKKNKKGRRMWFLTVQRLQCLWSWTGNILPTSTGKMSKSFNQDDSQQVTAKVVSMNLLLIKITNIFTVVSSYSTEVVLNLTNVATL